MTSPEPFDIGAVRARVAAHRPVVRRRWRGWKAATALIVTPSETGVDVAFIEKATRDGDRWSGQMALPGGRYEPGDADLVATAVRETHEEVGVDLPAPVGRLDDQGGRIQPGLVATYVFAVEERPRLRPDPTEVAAAMWIPLAHLLDPAAVTRIRWAGMTFPGIAHEGRVVWGLTHRIVASFAVALGRRLPDSQ